MFKSDQNTVIRTRLSLPTLSKVATDGDAAPDLGTWHTWWWLKDKVKTAIYRTGPAVTAVTLQLKHSKHVSNKSISQKNENNFRTTETLGVAPCQSTRSLWSCPRHPGATVDFWKSNLMSIPWMLGLLHVKELVYYGIQLFRSEKQGYIIQIPQTAHFQRHVFRCNYVSLCCCWS